MSRTSLPRESREGWFSPMGLPGRARGVVSWLRSRGVHGGRSWDAAGDDVLVEIARAPREVELVRRAVVEELVLGGADVAVVVDDIVRLDVRQVLVVSGQRFVRQHRYPRVAHVIAGPEIPDRIGE